MENAAAIIPSPPGWHAALAAAQTGELAPAEAMRAATGDGDMLNDLFYGRCLAEAGMRIDEAIALLRSVLGRDPANPVTPHMLALALARGPSAGDRAEAVAIWKQRGLPHDLDLLGQAALTFELQLRPIEIPGDEPGEAAQPPLTETALLWPSALPRLIAGMTRPWSDEPVAESQPTQPCDNLTHVERQSAALPAPPGFFARRGLKRSLDALEQCFLNHEDLKLLKMSGELLDRGLETAELHLVSGMAAEELDLPLRARAHILRSLELEPALQVARTALGRLWWRLGETGLAMAVWRSLPVEGPYDHGRHYHLALGHAAADDRIAARQAMSLALSDFFYDTRHFYIRRAWERWERRMSPPGTAEKA